MKSYMRLALGLLLITFVTHVRADETKPTSKEEAAQAKALANFEALQSANKLINYARTERAPEAMLTAARILGTTPVQKLEVELIDGKPVEKQDSDPAEALQKQALELVDEALEMSKDLPDGERKAVQALAQSLKERLAERDRNVVGGMKFIPGFINPGGTAVYTFDLVGGSSSMSVNGSNPFATLNMRVVGALTGLQYATDFSPGPNASVFFTHLPIAKVNVVIINTSAVPTQFTLTAN